MGTEALSQRVVTPLLYQPSARPVPGAMTSLRHRLCHYPSFHSPRGRHSDAPALISQPYWGGCTHGRIRAFTPGALSFLGPAMGLQPPEEQSGLLSGPQSHSHWAQGRLSPLLVGGQAWARVQQALISHGFGLR